VINLTPEQMSLIQLTMTLIVGIVGYAIKSTLQSINHQIESHEHSIHAQSNRLDAIDIDVARITERQSHVQALIAEKIDRLHDKVDRQQEMMSTYIAEQRKAPR